MITGVPRHHTRNVYHICQFIGQNLNIDCIRQNQLNTILKSIYLQFKYWTKSY